MQSLGLRPRAIKPAGMVEQKGGYNFSMKLVKSGAQLSILCQEALGGPAVKIALF